MSSPPRSIVVNNRANPRSLFIIPISVVDRDTASRTFGIFSNNASMRSDARSVGPAAGLFDEGQPESIMSPAPQTFIENSGDPSPTKPVVEEPHVEAPVGTSLQQQTFGPKAQSPQRSSRRSTSVPPVRQVQLGWEEVRRMERKLRRSGSLGRGLRWKGVL